MPELPEVETIVRDLQRLVAGARLRDVQVLRPDLIAGEPPRGFETALRGARIEQVSRRAKNIVFALDHRRLVVNLGMTGNLLVLPGGSPEPPHLGVRLDLQDGRWIAYRDVRRFGRLELLPAPEWAARAARLGIEPLSRAFTAATLHQLASRSRVAVKTWLMDQRRVVGVGNIYASEALFRARIHPTRPAHSLTSAEAARLHRAIRAVLREAIDFRGTTLLDYRDAAGTTGAFARQLRVYDRAGQPCPACRAPLLRIVQGGRSTFLCADCQR